MGEAKTKEGKAAAHMLEAVEFLITTEASRENSLAITKLEEALMWCNKDRTIKGEFSPTPTHIQTHA